MEAFYKELPDNYEMVYKIDANSKKMTLLFTLGSLVITAVFLAFVIALPFIYTPASATPRLAPDIYFLMFAVLLILYIILHELTHGAAYKILTHEKLTFGITFTCAFCGVPNIYVSRRTSIIALCTPLVVFSVIFVALSIGMYFYDYYLFYVFGGLFAFHIGGCIGDIYDLILLNGRFKDDRILVKDTGPAQMFYLPAKPNEENSARSSEITDENKYIAK